MESDHPFGLEICCQFLQQLRPVLRAVLAGLFVLDDVGPDEPVAQDERLVDGRSSAALELDRHSVDRFDETRIVHAGR